MKTQNECDKVHYSERKIRFNQYVYNVIDNMPKDMSFSSMRQCKKSRDVFSRLNKYLLYYIGYMFVLSNAQ